MTDWREAFVAFVDPEEGGVKDVGDRMGVTHYGQTEAWCRQWGLPVPQDPGQANANWRAWLKLTRIGEVCDLAGMVGVALADFAVNAGEGTAVRALQHLLLVAADGALGPVTLAALPGTRVAQHALFARLLAARLYAWALTMRADSSKREFAGGWMDRAADMLALWAKEVEQEGTDAGD